MQQMVNLTVTGRHGLVNGYIVSLLPGGAMIAAPTFGWAIRAFGVRATLWGFAATLVVTGLLSARLTARAGTGLAAATSSVTLGAEERRRAVFWRLSLVFFLAASAGLMVLSQAAGIIAAYGGGPALAVYGTTAITAVIAAARLGGGWMVDWLAIPTVAAGANAVALAGNVALTLWPGPTMAVLTLGLVGLGYGLVSGVTAAAVAVYWRRAVYGRMASRVYIAWCAAAIVLPIVAGRLFDLTHGYGAAVLIAGGSNALGVLLALGLPRQRTGPEPPRRGLRYHLRHGRDLAPDLARPPHRAGHHAPRADHGGGGRRLPHRRHPADRHPERGRAALRRAARGPDAAGDAPAHGRHRGLGARHRVPALRARPAGGRPGGLPRGLGAPRREATCWS